MEWIAFAKSDSAAFGAYGIDYARRRKKVVAADYHACGMKMDSVPARTAMGAPRA
ncbi:hypothetical protein ACWGS9_02955 [Bradyrhizobium sp. Arg314]